MKGTFLKSWAVAQKLRPEELAAKMGVSIGTLYKWFRTDALDKRTVLALAQIGCVEPRQRSQASMG